MANRVKEDEKNERIIRGLLKLPENRRCINCNSLGPQYVCINFWTFVCTTCSGIHREFTHRVKSISMAKFTSQEVAALQERGNKRGREIYLKEWDPQRQTPPDGSNIERLRDFIKHVYVERRFTGDSNRTMPASLRMADKDDYETRRNDSYQGGSRSPPYEDSYGRRYGEMSSPGGRSDDRNSRYSHDEGRSPGYDQDSRQSNDNGRSPSRPGIVNDWRRDDRFGNGLKDEGKSPDRSKDLGGSSPPVIRPVREILGDNVVPLRISEPPKVNAVKVADIPAKAQRTASSGSLGSTNANPVEIKVETPASLIDFDYPEPASSIASKAPQATIPQPVGQPNSTISDNNWASFDTAPQVKASQASSPLDSVLSQLSAPSSVPGSVSGSQSAANAAASSVNAPLMPFSSGVPTAVPANTLLSLQPGGASPAVPSPSPMLPINGGISFSQATDSRQWPAMQQPALFPASSVQSTPQQFASPFEAASGNQQPWSSSLAQTVQAAFDTTPGGAPQIVSKPFPVPSGAPQASVADVKSIGRKELPEDLFTMTYPSYSASFPGWQTGPPRGLWFPMQYGIAAVPMPTVLQSSKSMNPFDINESGPAQAQNFPSMANLQGALPNVPPPGIMRTSNLGTPTPAWMPPQSLPYSSSLPSQAPSYAQTMPPSAYMVQQVPSNMLPSGHQGLGGFGEAPSFSAANLDQQLASGFSAPPTAHPFPSVGGNPFG